LVNQKSSMKKIGLFFGIIFLLFPMIVCADGQLQAKQDEAFKAKVLEIIEEKDNKLSDNSVVRQQNLKLIGLDGTYEGKEFIFTGINSFGIVKNSLYKKGERVMVVVSYDDSGTPAFYITDHVRGDIIFWLFGLFVLVLVSIGKGKGIRSLISLILTFLVVIKFIIPQILNGGNILLTTVVGALLILIAIIYITEGFNKIAHVSILSSLFVLIITMFLSFIFVDIAQLSGMFSEEVAYLVNIGTGVINFKGLLLAGIIIGTLGVMDDVIIAQVVTVEEIYKTNPKKTRKDVFSSAYRIGISHISSMTNTLFLAYAGASLPLLVLFISGKSSFSTWGQIINNEAIATEIVRTLAGSIGLIFAVPIATVSAVWILKEEKNN